MSHPPPLECVLLTILLSVALITGVNDKVPAVIVSVTRLLAD